MLQANLSKLFDKCEIRSLFSRSTAIISTNFIEISSVYFYKDTNSEYEMAAKLLVTLTVVFAAYLIIKRRQTTDLKRLQAKNVATTTNTDERQNNELTTDIRIGAYLFLIMMMTVSASMAYFSWKNDHEKVLVTLYRQNNAHVADEKIFFHVYRQDLLERSFTTVDGIKVVVASDERMEIRDL